MYVCARACGVHRVCACLHSVCRTCRFEVWSKLEVEDKVETHTHAAPAASATWACMPLTYTQDARHACIACTPHIHPTYPMHAWTPREHVTHTCSSRTPRVHTKLISTLSSTSTPLQTENPHARCTPFRHARTHTYVRAPAKNLFYFHIHAKLSFAHRLQTAEMASSRTSAPGPRSGVSDIGPAEQIKLGCRVKRWGNRWKKRGGGTIHI